MPGGAEDNKLNAPFRDSKVQSNQSTLTADSSIINVGGGKGSDVSPTVRQRRQSRNSQIIQLRNARDTEAARIAALEPFGSDLVEGRRRGTGIGRGGRGRFGRGVISTSITGAR